MSFETPDLRTLIERSQSDIEAELPGASARLRRSNLNVLARVQAGMTHGMYGFVREFLNQCLPWSRGFLLRTWADLWGIRQKAATPASGTVSFTGVNGKALPSGTAVQAADNTTYTTTADAVISAGSAQALCVADVAGAAGNQPAGTALSLVNPVDGISGTALAAAGFSGGTDDESLDALYARYQQRVQNPGHGGNAADYISWALEVPGVTRAWVFTDLDGVDSVQVYFVRDADVSIIPDLQAVAAVRDYLRAPDRKPVTAPVTVYAPVPKSVHFTIKAIPDTPAVRASIEAELRDLVRREADLGGTLLRTHIDEAISLAQGEDDHVLTEPVNSVATAFNEIVVFGGITWST